MANVSYDEESHTLTNHELDKTYTFGQRGKRAGWVKDWIEENGLPDYKPEEEEVEETEQEPDEVSYDDATKTFTNHTLGKTYTYGQRGKRAGWVVAYEEEHGIEAPPKVNATPVDAEDVEHHITFDKDEGVLTNHTIDKTYTFGQRGKKPAWVRAWIVDNEESVPVNSNKNEQDTTSKPNRGPNRPKYKTSPTGLREWHFKSEMNNQCILVAKSPVDAMFIYNSQTKFPLTTRSLEIFWQETDYVCGFDEGCWRFDPESEEWESYGDYKNRLEQARLARVNDMMEEAEASEQAMADAAEEVIDTDEREIVEDEAIEQALDDWSDHEPIEAAEEVLAEDESTSTFD